jgi:hypothetical protein
MSKLRLGIITLVIFMAVAILAYILLPQEILANPLTSLTVCLAVVILVMLRPQSRVPRNFLDSLGLSHLGRRSNKLAWCGLGLIASSFVWLIFGLWFIGFTHRQSIGIALFPAMGLMLVGGVLIVPRLAVFLLSLMGQRD